MARSFIDTNILVNANDRRDPRKQDIAIAVVGDLMANGLGVISTQVLQEYAAVALNKLGQAADVVARQLLLLEQLEVTAVSPGMVRRAVELRGFYAINYWDACILAAAESTNCERVLSEDLQAGGLYSGIRVVNPFG